VREVDFSGVVLDQGVGGVGGGVADAQDDDVLVFECGEFACLGGV
jgi:hypothetical protein